MLRCLKISGIVVLSLLLLWFAGLSLFTYKVFSYIDAAAEISVPSESGITVLTGGRHRIAKGLELLEQGKGRRLLISGVQNGVRLDEIAAQEKVHLYDDMPVDLGYKARTTEGNAKEIRDWFHKYRFKTLYAVTSFYHVPRSRLELLHEMPDADIRFVAVGSEFVQPQWWSHLGSFKFLAAEYCKYMIVKLQYWFSKK